MTINWTPDRPTKPGEYWLSLCPDKRNPGIKSVIEARISGTDLPLVFLHDNGSGSLTMVPLRQSLFDGALWSVRETPADPFAKPETMRTDQDGREYNHDDREQKLNSDALVKKAIQHLRKRKPRNGRGYIYPLWKRVADLFGHGSGYSAEICRRHGFDPDEEWKPEWQCPDCKRLVNPEELRPAPCNYEQDVNGNDTPYVMCSQCRSERNDAI